MVEGQGPYNVTLVLSAQPTSSVTVTLSISETFQQNEGRTGLTIAANTRSHVFRPDNWNTPFVAQLLPQDDSIAENPYIYDLSVAVASDDPSFAGLATQTAVLQLDDDDSARV